MNLTEQQKSAVRDGKAVRIHDEGTECVVVRADMYDRLKDLLHDDNDWAYGEMRRTLGRSVEANGWNEPDMAVYDNYDEEIQKRCP